MSTVVELNARSRARTLREMARDRSAEALVQLELGRVEGYRSRTEDAAALLREARRLEAHQEAIDEERRRTALASEGILDLARRDGAWP